MKAINQTQFQQWCSIRGLELSERRYLQFRDPEMQRQSLLIKVPDSAGGMTGLAGWSFPFDFGGAIVWIREAGIWGELSEGVGLKVLQNMRRAYGETRPLAETPVHVFDHDEHYDAYAFWLQPLIFGWDAFMVPEGAQYFAFASHDEVISFVTRNQEVYRKLTQQLDSWNPIQNDPYYLGLVK